MIYIYIYIICSKTWFVHFFWVNVWVNVAGQQPDPESIAEGPTLERCGVDGGLKFFVLGCSETSLNLIQFVFVAVVVVVAAVASFCWFKSSNVFFVSEILISPLIE